LQKTLNLSIEKYPRGINSSASNGTVAYANTNINSSKSSGGFNKQPGELSQSLRKANLLKEQLTNNSQTQGSMPSPNENNKLLLSTENNFTSFLKKNKFKNQITQLIKNKIGNITTQKTIETTANNIKPYD
jgi:hypothetical protein